MLAPDPGVLWALSKVYGVDFNELVASLVANRNDPTLAALPRTLENVADPTTVVDRDDRAVFEAVRGLPTAARREVLTYIAFLELRELPADERETFLETIKTSVELARALREAAGQSGDRTDAETPATGHRKSRKRGGAA